MIVVFLVSLAMRMTCAMVDNDDDDLLPTKGNCKPQPGHVAHAVGASGTEVVGDGEGGGIYRCTLCGNAYHAVSVPRRSWKTTCRKRFTEKGPGAPYRASMRHRGEERQGQARARLHWLQHRGWPGPP